VKIVIDGETFVIVGHVQELVSTAGLSIDGVKLRHDLKGGASQFAISIKNQLDAAAERVIASMSDVGHGNATLRADQPESISDSRSRVISVRKAAERHNVDPRTILRWMKRDPDMIASDHPYRLDPDAVDAYASGRPRRRSAA
jgi:hypothetical protein